ncbi:MAG TPA: hypothetical protein VJW73_09820, partial [Gemmatimonadaceae bacterium]|nr:hypothetical protein [Gemmatimonadaceae bacterium]
MSPQRLLRSFLFLWVVTGVALLYGSVATARSALQTGAHLNPHLVLLASVEALAAILFLIPRLMRIGAIGLLATIFVAFTVHAALHEFRADLVLYGAAVLFVMIHGSLTHEQLRAAMSR